MTKDKLTQEEIDAADYVIIAKGKGIDNPERFDGKKVLDIDVQAPIKEPEKTVDRILTESVIQESGRKAKSSANMSKTADTEGSKKRKKFGTGPMRHLMAGISYMIPFIAFAGIILGFTTAFGFDQFVVEVAASEGYIGIDIDAINQYLADNGPMTIPEFEAWMDATYGGDWQSEIVQTVNFMPTSAAAAAFDKIAGAGFTLFIPILGGFIANSIAGRQALAPAMMLSIIVTSSADATMFN